MGSENESDHNEKVEEMDINDNKESRVGKTEKMDTNDDKELNLNEKVEEIDGNDNKIKQKERISQREDLTPFFKERDHSVNQIYHSEVSFHIYFIRVSL